MQGIVLCVAALVACALAASVDVDVERQKLVDYINNIPGNTWKAGFNPRFAGKPLGASKDLLGVKPGSHAKMMAAVKSGKAIMAPQITEEQAAAIPAAFDSATNWPACATIIDDIRDQSNCGCCWAFGAAEAASDRMCIASKGALLFPLSAQALCFCSSADGCNGGDLNTPWDYIKRVGLVTGGSQGNGTFDKDGLCSAFSLPHCHHHGPQGNDPYPDEGSAGCPSESSPRCPKACDPTATAPHNSFATDKYTFSGSTMVLPGNAATIQQAIMTDGPVEAAFTVYQDFENYVSGVYQPKSKTVLGGHAIKIVGWGVDSGVAYWKVANSWNPYWGESGYFRIIRGVDSCGIEDDVTASSSGSTWSKK